jgi:hypothetical protein
VAIRISFQNSGGELDCRVVETAEEARNAAIEIISSLNDLQPGDKIVIEEGK